MSYKHNTSGRTEYSTTFLQKVQFLSVVGQKNELIVLKESNNVATMVTKQLCHIDKAVVINL